MALLTHTGESVTLNYALETFTFCSTYHIHFIAFSENVNGNGFSEVLFNR
jgi:hypothetical protein